MIVYLKHKLFINLDTSRRRQSDERNGESWHFISEEDMLSSISKHHFLEYGQHEGSLYGTKLSAVQDVIRDGKIPILDIETPVSLASALFKSMLLYICNCRTIFCFRR